ncbi:MAG: hypothetical protein QOG84_1433 [Sphingomonadales bacterium]|jgi:hypothetical protein|nr:hypothetical protein [Sphingomonadales bacterium]
MDGRLFFAFLFVVGLADLIMGWRWSQFDSTDLEPNPDGSPRSPEEMRRLGRIMMISGPLFWILGAVVAFGLMPVDGIDPIHFSQG